MVSKEGSFVEFTGGTSVHRHMIHMDHTLCIRHTEHMLYTVYLERSCHTVEWVMDTLDRNTSDYLQGMGDTLKELWEIHRQDM